jgi:uncharacterized protein (DUF58 family)
MIFPTLRLLFVSLGIFTLSLGLNFIGLPPWIFLLAQLGLILLATVEGFLIKTLNRYRLNLKSASHYIGLRSRTFGILEGPVHPWLKLVLRFNYPGWCEVEALRLSFATLHEKQEFIYPFTPLKRGDFSLKKIPYRLTGILGLAMVQGDFPVDSKQTCIPNTKEVADFLKLRKLQTRDSWGYLPYSLAHQSGELDSLREYTPDDDASRIEWRASTRISETGYQSIPTRSFRLDHHYSGLRPLDDHPIG